MSEQDADLDARGTDVHATDEHTTDKADLEARDRAQQTRIGRAVNLRADGDALPDEDERAALVDEVQQEREEPTEELVED